MRMWAQRIKERTESRREQSSHGETDRTQQTIDGENEGERVELKNILTVKKIAELGSYQQAAYELGYVQSTITFQVKQLENELGVKLFERRGSRMALTQTGQELLPYFDEVANSVSKLKAASARDDMRGTLTVALPESLVTYRMQPVLAEFKRRAPNVSLKLHVENCYAIRQRMLNGGADVALHYDVADYPGHFEIERLEAFPLVLLGSPMLSESERDFVAAGQRKDICHIQNDPDALYLRIWNAYLENRSIVLAPGLEVWSIEAVKRCAISGLGVAYLPRFVAEEEIASQKLVELPTHIENGSMTAICVTDDRHWKSPAAQLFSTLAARHLKA